MENSGWKASVDEIADFVPLETVEKRLEEINADSLSPEHERAVISFQRAFHRKREGKKEDGWPIDDE